MEKENKKAPFKVLSLNNGKMVIEYDLVAPHEDNLSASGDNFIIGKAYGQLKLNDKSLTVNGVKIKIQTFIRVAAKKKSNAATEEVSLTPPPVIAPPEQQDNAQ